MKADLITVTLPIEVNSVKVSSESFLSQFLEIADEFIELRFVPVCLDGEICAPRRQSKGHGDTCLLESGQVCNESWGSLSGIMSIETVWEEPCLLLSTSICVVLSRVEPRRWLIDFDISNHCNLVNWSIQGTVDGDLTIFAIDLCGQTLCNSTRISPYCLLFSMTFVSLSSMWWWENTWSILHIFVICVPPLPCLNISAFDISGTGCVALSIFSDACWSVLGDVILLAMIIFDVLVDHGPFECISCRQSQCS